MSDQELLELAAKAAGMNGYEYRSSNAFYGDHFETRWAMHKNGHAPWNPLVCSKDAMHLATRLCMSISTCLGEARANTISGALRGNFFREDVTNQCRDKAVLRVIVRAAAEVAENS